MACFLVPVAEAVITTVAGRVIKSKEIKTVSLQSDEQNQPDCFEKLHFSDKLKWLSNMLWGGSALLCFEHIWHGEIVPYFPFLTAASDPEEFGAMLKEMATVGSSMALFITAVWVAMVITTTVIEKRAETAEKSKTGDEI